MNHLDKGFVVPVWFRHVARPGAFWLPGWATADGTVAVAVGWESIEFFAVGTYFADRDPNRADDRDRPDLLEAS